MVGGIRRCHICNSPNHLQAQCPNNPIKSHGTALNNNYRNVKKVNTIQVSSNAKRTRGGYCYRETHTSQCQTENDSPEVNSDLSNDGTNEMSVQENAIAEAAALFGGNPSGHASVNEVVAVVNQPQNLDCLKSALPDSGNVSKQKSASQGVPLEQMSQLSYLPVRISEAPSTGKYRVVNALLDSGSEIAVVSRKHVTDFDCAPLAKVQLRAFIGTAVEADVVKLYVRRARDNGEDGRCITVCCAVCDDMREDLILTSSIIGKLGALPVNAVTINSSPREEDRPDGAINMDGHTGSQRCPADNTGQGPGDNDSNGAQNNMPRPHVDQDRDGGDGGEMDAARTPGGTNADDGRLTLNTHLTIVYSRQLTVMVVTQCQQMSMILMGLWIKQMLVVLQVRN